MSGLGPTGELVGVRVRPKNDKGLDGGLSMSSTAEERKRAWTGWGRLEMANKGPTWSKEERERIGRAAGR